MDPNKQQILQSWLFSCDISNSKADLCIDICCACDENISHIQIKDYQKYLRQIEYLKVEILTQLKDVNGTDDMMTYDKFIEDRQKIADKVFSEMDIFNHYIREYYNRHINNKLHVYYHNPNFLFPTSNFSDYYYDYLNNLFVGVFGFSYSGLDKNSIFIINNINHKFDGIKFYEVKEYGHMTGMEIILSQDNRILIESINDKLKSIKHRKAQHVNIKEFMVLCFDKIALQKSKWIEYSLIKYLPDDNNVIHNLIYEKRYLMRSVITVAFILVILVLIILYLLK